MGQIRSLRNPKIYSVRLVRMESGTNFFRFPRVKQLRENYKCTFYIYAAAFHRCLPSHHRSRGYLKWFRSLRSWSVYTFIIFSTDPFLHLEYTQIANTLMESHNFGCGRFILFIFFFCCRKLTDCVRNKTTYPAQCHFGLSAGRVFQVVIKAFERIRLGSLNVSCHLNTVQCLDKVKSPYQTF